MGFTNGRPKRFSIDDAFEEETDEAIKVYGGNCPRSPTSINMGQGDQHSLTIDNGRLVPKTTTNI